MPRRQPHQSRPFLRLTGALALSSGLLALSAGCESLRGTTTPEPTPNPAPQARGTGETAPAPTPVIPSIPGKYTTRRSEYYVLYHDFPIDQADPLFTELEALPERVFEELGLQPGTTMVQVFLFDTQDHYERFMKAKYSNLPPRRAYFIAEPRLGGKPGDLKIYTWMGDHLRTDLRHELTHAILHSVLKDVPLWLDEGLAGFFELPPASDGVNAQHLDVLRRSDFQPDLARLEKFEKVKQMEKPEYREAWAWAHLMLRGRPEFRKPLQDYLQALRTNPNPGPLLPRLQEIAPEPELALTDHLNRLESPRFTSDSR